MISHVLREVSLHVKQVQMLYLNITCSVYEIRAFTMDCVFVYQMSSQSVYE